MEKQAVAKLAQLLPEEQRRDISVELAKDLAAGNPGASVDVLYDLVKCVSPGTKEVISPFLYKFFNEELIQRKHHEITPLAFKLLGQFVGVAADLLSMVAEKLTVFAYRNKLFFEGVIEVFDDKSLNFVDSVELPDVHYFFEFLNVLFKENDNLAKIATPEIDRLCFLYLTCDDSQISNSVVNVLRWKLEGISADFDQLWACVSTLLRAKDAFKRTNGLIIWLCYLKQYSTTDSKLQETYSTNDYWLFLKQSLVGDSHDHKKMALSIIQLTVTSVTRDIANDYMTWKVSESEQYIDAWKRFCTLYEIVGIDTSLHQAEDAASDLVGALSINSKIPPPFALALLSIGFKSSQDSVRKFAMDLVFAIPPENLALLSTDLSFLEETFLPFVLHAYHYSVKRDSKSSTGSSCGFLSRLIHFVAHCVSSQSDAGRISALSAVILRILVKNKLAFDAARIALALGLLKGLDTCEVLLDSTNMSLLNEMFESVSENDIYERVLQTIFLRILLWVKADCHELYQRLGRFLKVNPRVGVEVLKEHIKLVQSRRGEYTDVAVELFDLFSFAAYAIVEKWEYHRDDLISLIQDLPDPHAQAVILCSLLDGAVVRSMECTMHDGEDLFQNSILDPEIRRFYSTCNGFSTSNVDTFQKLAKVISTSTDEAVLSTAIFRLELLSKDPTFRLPITDCVDLMNSAIKTRTSRNSSDFYRVKDIFHASLFRIICNSYQEKDLEMVIAAAEKEGVFFEYEARLAVVKLISQLLEQPSITQYVRRLCSVLHNVWTEMVDERLTLKHKQLHCALIKAFFHRIVLLTAVDDISIREMLVCFGSEVIEQSFSRRSLMPSMFSAIDSMDVSVLCELDCLIPLLIRGITTKQENSNLFILEPVIAEIYDRDLGVTRNGLYDAIYGDEEISYRVAITSILSKFEGDIVQKTIQFLHDNEEELHIRQPKHRTDGLEEWKRLQLISVILLLSGKLSPEDQIKVTRDFGTGLIFNEQSPLVRTQMEWLISLCMLRNPSSRYEILEFFKKDVLRQGSIPVTTFERTCVLLGQKLDAKDAIEFMRDFIVKYLVPSATSNKAWHRHFAVSLVCSVYPEILKRQLELSDDVIEILENVYRIAASSEGFGTHRNGDAHLWDITGDFTLVGLFGGVLTKVSDREDIETIPQLAFEKYLRAPVSIPVGTDFASFRERTTDSKAIDVSRFNSPLQKKSGTWSTPVDLDQVIGNGSTISTQRSQLIVVSSLVDKPPNLGGICRLCDVLGAGLLTLNDIRVKDHPVFKNVAVTADRWMPMVEVTPDQIADFMVSKKREGYTLIGLEQTDKSVVLDEKLKFPEKSLILLGREKEGIPGDLLAILDMCIEIKQVGVIRSMNIQTATAVIVHAYSTQHC